MKSRIDGSPITRRGNHHWVRGKRIKNLDEVEIKGFNHDRDE